MIKLIASAPLQPYLLSVIRRECGQTLGRVRVRTVVIISLQWTKG